MTQYERTFHCLNETCISSDETGCVFIVKFMQCSHGVVRQFAVASRYRSGRKYNTVIDLKRYIIKPKFIN